MTLKPDRLQPFEPRRQRTQNEMDDGWLEAAQDAGIALKTMRKAAGLTVPRLADLIGMSVEDLKRAEAGQLVKPGKDGELLDVLGALLVFVARVTDQDAIPLPPRRK